MHENALEASTSEARALVGPWPSLRCIIVESFVRTQDSADVLQLCSRSSADAEV